MFIKKFILRTAGASLAAIICLAVQSLGAQTSSESKEIAGVEARGRRTQTGSQQLEKTLRACGRWAKGKQKRKSFMMGRLMLRKASPLRSRPRTSGNYPLPLARWNSSATSVSVTNITEARPKARVRWRRPVRASQGQTIGRSASASVIVFAWAFVERFWMIGSSAFDWRRTTMTAQQM